MIVLATVYIVILSSIFLFLIISHFCHAGHECAVKLSIMVLDNIKIIDKARELENKCKRGKEPNPLEPN